jgi:precorrin-2 dehydrogenase/sirohydrochlorin ferrochelatase
MNVPAYYPIFLDLTQRRCLVVGGGPVAERKVHGLLEAGAQVWVVSPALTDALGAWAADGALTHLPRTFQDDDVEDCALVIAATDRGEVNGHVAGTARRHGVLVNVVDTPEACDFIAPAVVRRGALQIAISTGGKSPMLAKRLREGLDCGKGSTRGSGRSMGSSLTSSAPCAPRCVSGRSRRRSGEPCSNVSSTPLVCHCLPTITAAPQ